MVPPVPRLVVRSAGIVVVFDRHFFADYHAYDVDGERRLPLSRRIHGYLLAKAYPKPDLVVYLDAPADVLLARKGEGSAELLEQRRDDYLALGEVTPDFAVVDATHAARGRRRPARHR